MDTTAYAVSDFAVMVCHVVNEGVIKKHAIYGPGGDSVKPEWYCAAVDLVDPGMTFKLFFTLENGKIHVQELSRWWFG